MPDLKSIPDDTKWQLAAKLAALLPALYDGRCLAAGAGRACAHPPQGCEPASLLVRPSTDGGIAATRLYAAGTPASTDLSPPASLSSRSVTRPVHACCGNLIAWIADRSGDGGVPAAYGNTSLRVSAIPPSSPTALRYHDSPPVRCV